MVKYVIKVIFKALPALIALILSACSQPTGGEMINDKGEAYFLSADHADLMVLPWQYASPIRKLRVPISKKEAANNDRYYKGRYNKIGQLIEILEYRQQRLFQAEKIHYVDNEKVHSTVIWVPNRKIIVDEYDSDGRTKKMIEYFEKPDKSGRVSIVETLLSIDKSGAMIEEVIKEIEVKGSINDILKEVYGKINETRDN